MFPKDSFYNYLRKFEAQHMRTALRALFVHLRTKPEDRDPYTSEDLLFPYVNGGLSEEVLEIPNFTEDDPYRAAGSGEPYARTGRKFRPRFLAACLNRRSIRKSSP